MGKHTPGPWKWQEARHTGDSKAEPRTIVSLSVNQRAKDGRDLGPKHVLVQGVKMRADLAAAVRDLQCEIHATPEDEALIEAAPDLLEVCDLMLRYYDNETDDSVHLEHVIDAIRAAAAKARGEGSA